MWIIFTQLFTVLMGIVWGWFYGETGEPNHLVISNIWLAASLIVSAIGAAYKG